MFSVACSVGFASCKTFGKQPKHPCFGRSPNAGCQSLVSLHRAATVCDLLQASLLGEGGSPTLSPFPRGRGLGLGIENKHFFGKTDFFYSLEPPCFARRFYTYVQNTQNPADNFGYNLTLATLQRKVHCVILSTTKQKGAVYESTT